MSKVVPKNIIKLEGDKGLWAIYISLVFVSLIVVFSSTESLALRIGTPWFFIIKHTIFILVGATLAYVFHKFVRYTYHFVFANIFYLLGLGLLVLTLFYGVSLNQASRWIVIPGTGFTFQSSDLAKFALINFLAARLYKLKDDVRKFKVLFWHLVIPTLLIVILIMPANLSTAIIVTLASFILIWIGGARLWHLLLVGLIGIILMVSLIWGMNYFMPHSRVGTWKNRIERFINNDDKKTDELTAGNYQATQAKIAIATGGLVGKGAGKSVQKSVLPHPYSDFIFAIILEEYGLWGGFIVMSFYVFLFFRVVRLSARVEQRSFAMYLMLGIVLIITLQAFVNMAVAVGIMPVTGQPLPLISMGGSSFIIMSIAYGILISISKTVDKKDKNKIKKDKNEAGLENNN